jgi:hypothetical protein
MRLLVGCRRKVTLKAEESQMRLYVDIPHFSEGSGQEEHRGHRVRKRATEKRRNLWKE